MVQRIMQKYGWQCRVRPKKRRNTGQPFHIAHNVLQRQFKADFPKQKLVTDITYLPYGEKVLYLSSIMDLYNGEILAYTIDDTQDISLVLDTLAQVSDLRSDCILHSDQGSVYTSEAYQQMIKKRDITMSMSHKGTPVDNAPIESFHSSLKSETFYLERINRTTTSVVTQIVQKFIHQYNYTRIQTKLNNQSPINFR